MNLQTLYELDLAQSQNPNIAGDVLRFKRAS
jgi:hypothetical protein